jgi:hypothetical protein
MRRAPIYLGAILFLHLVGAILYEAYFWNYVPDGGPGGEWMISPATYWVPLLTLLILWLRTDAKERNAGIPGWALLVAPVLFPIGIPYYFFSTNPMRTAVLRLGLALLFVGACFGALWMGNRLAFNYYAVWTNR